MIMPYLCFDGSCEEAFRFYADAFDSEALMLQHDGNGRVMHAYLGLDESGGISGGDIDCPFGQGTDVHILAALSSSVLADKAWAKLVEGADILMDMAPTDYAARQGTLRDKFGFTWVFSVPPGQ